MICINNVRTIIYVNQMLFCLELFQTSYCTDFNHKSLYKIVVKNCKSLGK